MKDSKFVVLNGQEMLVGTGTTRGQGHLYTFPKTAARFTPDKIAPSIHVLDSPTLACAPSKLHKSLCRKEKGTVG